MLKKLPLKILDRIIPEDIKYQVIGDFEELLNSKISDSGYFIAIIWLWFQMVKSLPSFLKNTIYWRTIMFQSYLKIALRNLKNHPLNSIINVFGLTVGLGFSIVVMYYVFDEGGYDEYHAKKDNLYRLEIQTYYPANAENYDFAVTPVIWAPNMKKDIPEIENYTRFSMSNNEVEFLYNDKTIIENDVFYTENSVFDNFSWELLKGDPETVLSDMKTVVLSEETSKKIFNDEGGMGKTVIINMMSRNRRGEIVSQPEAFIVSGIMKDVPKKSHLRPKVLIPITNQNENYASDIMAGTTSVVGGWRSRNFYTYFVLNSNVKPESIQGKFKKFLDDYPINRETLARGYGYNLSLNNITDTHYTQNYIQDVGSTSNKMYIYVFQIIAILIIIIASANFINLSIARSMQRAKEVGLRKIVGAVKKQLVSQYIGESVLVSIIAMLTGLLLAYFLLPIFYQYLNKELLIDNSLLFSMVLPIIIVTLMIGIFSGIYPALLASSFSLTNILKQSSNKSNSKSLLRKGIAVFQFSISIFLIIATLTINNQLEYMREKDLGFNKDQVMVIPSRLTQALGTNTQSAKDELLKNPRITNVTFSSAIPGRAGGREMFGVVGNSDAPTPLLIEYSVDGDFMDTYEIELLEGRLIDQDNYTADVLPEDPDTYSLYGLVNESAVKEYGWGEPKNAIGKVLVRDPKDKDYYITIVGVVKDFHVESLYDEIKPVVMRVYPRGFYTSIKIESGNTSETINYVENIFAQFVPEEQFNYSFLDETLNRYYQNEEKNSTVFRYVSIVAIMIACMGLFGLVSFSTQSRAKEVGIRKILGASTDTLFKLLSKEFIILVSLANLISWPFAYIIMNKWLENFAYKSALSPTLFILTGVFALGIALITISVKIFKTVLSNPADTLRYE